MDATNQQDSNELYLSLPTDVCQELTSYEKEFKVPSGTKLIAQDISSENLIIIKQGSVEISMRIGDEIVQLAVAGCGKVLGLPAIMSRIQAKFEATTLEPCTVALIPGETFLAALKQHPEIYLAISRVLSRDLQNAENSLRRLPRGARGAAHGRPDRRS